MIARGERLTYTGEIYHLPLPGSEGKALVSFAQPRQNLPIYLATLGPKNLELTGELAESARRRWYVSACAPIKEPE